MKKEAINFNVYEDIGASPLDSENKSQSLDPITQQEVLNLISLHVLKIKKAKVLANLPKAKILDYQINEILNAIYKKKPALKKEILIVKKLLKNYLLTFNF